MVFSWLHGFRKFDTVEKLPDSFFNSQKEIYGRVERIEESGNQIRISHVPGFSVNRDTPQLPLEGQIEEATILIQLYGVKIPENWEPQAVEALQKLISKKMVKVTLLEKRQESTDDDNPPPAIAVAVVQMVENAKLGVKSKYDSNGDLTLLLVKAGLAEPLDEVSSGADSHNRDIVEHVAHHARKTRKGVWSRKPGMV